MAGSSLPLFRLLMKTTRVLPKDVINYYRGHLSNNFRQHKHETDPETISLIRRQALKDAEWVLKKYNLPIDKLKSKLKL